MIDLNQDDSISVITSNWLVYLVTY